MKERIIHLFKYSFWGGITSLINFLLFEIFICWGMNLILSNIMSYGVAVVLSYFFNARFVFGSSKNKRKSIEVGKYIIVRIISIVIDTMLLWLFVQYLISNELISKLIVSVLVILGTYFCNKIWVFRE